MSRLRFIVETIIFSLAIGLGVCLFNLGHTVAAAQPERTVFLLPHQDDEMFMAGAIKRALDLGRDVYVVMVTDGGASYARYPINGQDDKGRPVFCQLHHRRHHPATEGYAPLGRRAFSAFRNKEFYLSMIQLGVAPDHILFANAGGIAGTSHPRYIDRKLTADLAIEAVQKYYTLLGNGTYATVAAQLGDTQDAPGDHRALRDALAKFSAIKDKQFYAERPVHGTEIKLTKQEQQAKAAALSVYQEWNPKEGHFSIAALSVPDTLKEWRARTSEYLIAPEDF